MNKLFLHFTALLIPLCGFSQQKETSDKKEIETIMTTFMDCLIHKDSVKFYSLFTNEPVVWMGVFKEATQQDRLKKDSSKRNYFTSTYQKFYRSVADDGTDEEKFYTPFITEDGSVASVNFDYSFYENKKRINWGKESWALVKINGEWKITTVIFSLEMESVNPEPQVNKILK